MRKSKSSLFLMELIVVIFFFALTSAVCLQIFVKAHNIAANAEALNHASLYATNIGEVFYSCEGDVDKFAGMIKRGNVVGKISETETGKFEASYDADFNVTDEASKYSLVFTIDDSDTTVYCDFKFIDTLTGDVLFVQRFSKHKALRSN